MDLTKDIISHKSLYLESQKEIFELMGKIFHVLKKENLGDTLAYCYQNVYMNNQYEVYVNNIYEPAIDGLMVHEYGHILFSHFRGAKQKEEMLKRLIILNWPKISKYFEENISTEYVANWFATKLNNILMDYEVNSKLFTKEEFDTFMYLVDDLLITHYQYLYNNFPDNKEYKKQYTDIYKKKVKNPDYHLTTLCWPEDNGFPLKLSYEEYAALAIKDFEKFVNDQVQNIYNSLPDNSSQDNNQNGNSTIKIPTSYINSDNSTSEVNKKQSGNMNHKGSDEPRPCKTVTKSIGSQHSDNSNIIETGDSVADITDFIYKHAFIYKKEKTKRDLLYLYNKGRTRTTQTFVGYQRRHKKFHKATVAVLIDVSGSVNQRSVENTLASLKFLKNDFIEGTSHIISWDTDLVYDSYWIDMKVRYSGGGTTIAKGIKYTEKYIRKPYDKLFIISDFEDNLYDWAYVLEDYPGEKYGICTSNYVSQKRGKQLKEQLKLNDLFLYKEK